MNKLCHPVRDQIKEENFCGGLQVFPSCQDKKYRIETELVSKINTMMQNHTNYLLPTTYYLLLTTYYQILTTTKYKTEKKNKHQKRNRTKQIHFQK